MKAIVRELGSRPLISTPARMNAPQGATALADLMAEQDFADLCVINLDWEGDGFTPALVIDTIKWFIGNPTNRLSHQWVIDLEDAFGSDNMDNATLRLIVSELRGLFLRETEAFDRRNR